MPDSTYTLNTQNPDGQQFAASLAASAAAVADLGNNADRANGQLKGFLSTGRALTKVLNALNAAMAPLAAQAAAINAAFGGLTTSAATAGAGVAGVSTAVQGLNRSATSATAKTNSAAAAINAAGAAAVSATPSVAALNAAAAGLGTGLGGATGKSRALSGALGGIGMKAAGLMAVHAAIRALASGLQDARDFARETAAENEKLRESVRELRALGKPGERIDTTAQGVIDLMLTSGAKQEQAIEFDVMWKSAMSAAEKSGHWKLDEKETQIAKEEAAKFMVANNISGATMGRMVPAIGTSEDITSVDQIVGKMGAAQAMAIRGVGKFTPLLKAASALRGSMVRPSGTGPAKSFEALMGIVAATTSSTKSEAASVQAIDQVTRALSVAKSPEAEATFKKYGLDKANLDYPTMVERIAPLVEGAEKAGVSPAAALAQAGLKADAANKRIIAAVHDKKIIREYYDAAEAARDPARVRADTEQFRKDNPKAFAEAQLFRSRQGRGAENRDLESLRTAAEAGMTVPGSDLPIGGSVNAIFEGLQKALTLNTADPRLNKFDELIQRRIVARAPRLKDSFQGGITIATPEEHTRELLKRLTPEEHAAVQADMSAFALTGKEPEVAPVGRKPLKVVLPPGLQGVGGVGPQAAIDRRLTGPVDPDAPRGYGRFGTAFAMASLGAVGRGAAPGRVSPGGIPYVDESDLRPENRLPMHRTPGYTPLPGESAPRSPAAVVWSGGAPGTASEALDTQNEAKGLPPFRGTEKQAAKILAYRARKAGVAAPAKTWERRPESSGPAEVATTNIAPAAIQAAPAAPEYGPYAELEGSDGWGIDPAKDTRTNAEKAGKTRDRGPGWYPAAPWRQTPGAMAKAEAGAASAADARVPGKPSRFDDPNLFKVAPGAGSAYDPYSELEGGDAYPAEAATDTRTNAERAGKTRERGPGWVPAAEWRRTPGALARAETNAAADARIPGRSSRFDDPNMLGGGKSDPELVKQTALLKQIADNQARAQAVTTGPRGVGPLDHDGGDYAGRRM